MYECKEKVRMYKEIFGIAVLLAVTGGAGATQANDVLGNTVFTSSKWEVRTKTDPMTDKKECVATLQGNYRVRDGHETASCGGRLGVGSFRMCSR